MNKFDSEKQLFVRDAAKKKLIKLLTTNYELPDAPTVTEVENAIALPLRPVKKQVQGGVGDKSQTEGGICDSEGNFVAGHIRDPINPDRNRSCFSAYPLPSNIKTRHETVIYGGFLFNHFGHMIAEGISSRLHYLIDNPDTTYKFIFLDSLTKGEFTFYNVLEAVGITKDRMEIITEPTRFDKIIIPQEAVYLLSNYRPGAYRIYDYIREKVVPKPYKKVYLSASAKGEYSAKLNLNEEYFEDFFGRRGYEVVHPEALPFEEQVALMAGAEEVVCTSGSLPLLTAFCKPKVKLVILSRVDGQAAMFPMLQARETDFYIVDVHYDFLPANLNVNCVYLLGPTKYFTDYLDKAGIEYTPDEVSFDLHVRPYIADYVRIWGEKVSTPAMYKAWRNFTVIDIADRINYMFCGNTIERKKYADRDDVVKLKAENARLTSEVNSYSNVFKSALVEYSENHAEQIKESAESVGIDAVTLVDNSRVAELEAQVTKLKKENKGIKSSFSWRITKPLRAIKAWFKKLKKKK